MRRKKIKINPGGLFNEQPTTYATIKVSPICGHPVSGYNPYVICNPCKGRLQLISVDLDISLDMVDFLREKYGPKAKDKYKKLIEAFQNNKK